MKPKSSVLAYVMYIRFHSIISSATTVVVFVELSTTFDTEVLRAKMMRI